MRYFGVFIFGMIFGAFVLFGICAIIVESEAEEREERWWRK